MKCFVIYSNKMNTNFRRLIQTARIQPHTFVNEDVYRNMGA